MLDYSSLLTSCVCNHSPTFLWDSTFEQWYLEQRVATAAFSKASLSIESHLFNWLDDSDCSLPLPATELFLSSFSVFLLHSG